MFINENNLKELPQADVIPPSLELDSATSVRGDNFIMEQEVWVNIVGAAGKYQVSNLCQVKTTTNVNLRGRIMSGHPKIVEQHVNANGYLYSNMVLNGKTKMKPIHRLMAETFIPNPLNLPCVNHIDCDKLNNSISNLEWCTMEYNTKHAHANGRFPNPTGIKNGSAKITEEIALDIFTSRLSVKELVAKHGVHPSRVYDVRTGVSWNHITGLPLKNYRENYKNKKRESSN